jgi:hypothetical protein
MQPAEPGSFDVQGGVLTLPNGDTIAVTSGRLTVATNEQGPSAWTAGLRVVPTKALPQVRASGEAVHAYLLGKGFSWSGEAKVQFFQERRPLQNDVELEGIGALRRNLLSAD